jgi:CHAT domain-containing protein
MLVVAQPAAVGQASLPGTKEELDHIERHARGVLPQLIEFEATVQSAFKGMRQSNWLHFACHGVQDSQNPTRSALRLAGDSRLHLRNYKDVPSSR